MNQNLSLAYDKDNYMINMASRKRKDLTRNRSSPAAGGRTSPAGKIETWRLGGNHSSFPAGHPEIIKRLVGRASAPARRSAQAGKPVPPEELFRTAEKLISFALAGEYGRHFPMESVVRKHAVL
jgi:hypothetical protein